MNVGVLWPLHAKALNTEEGLLPRPSWLFFLREFPRETGTMLLFLILAGVVESVGAVSIVPLLGNLIGQGESDGRLAQGIGALFGLAGLRPSLGAALSVLCVAMLSKAIFLVVAYRQTGCIEAEVSNRLRLQLLDGLLHARWSYFVSQSTGKLSYALSAEAAQAGASLRIIAQAASLLFQTIAYLGVALFVSWQVLVAGVTVGAFFFYIFRGLITFVRRMGNRQTDALNAMAATFTDALGGAKPLKVMRAESGFMHHVRIQAEQVREFSRRLAFGMGLMQSVQEPSLTVLLAIGLYLAANRLQMDAATLLSMAFFFQRIVSRFSGVQQSLQNYASYEGSLRSLVEKIAVTATQGETLTGGRAVTLENEVRLCGVNFSYGDRQILRDFSLSVFMGQITALYGPSGSGKTTVADIIASLVQPDSGEVLVDGVPLSEMDIKAWRGQIGYVPQEVFLFHDTIRENISLGRDCSDADIWTALDRAGARDFVEQTQQGLDTVVGEYGRALSGGQRQRLMIARALVMRPRLIILDEATTGLDEATERAIWQNVAGMRQDMAVLAVSHQEVVRSVADTTYRFEGSV